MIIRIADRKDFSEIQRLNYLLFKKEFEEYEPTLSIDYPYENKRGREYFMEAIKEDKYLTLVAEDKGKIIGYLIGYFNGNQEYRLNVIQATLMNMYVEEDFRNKSIGTELVKEFSNWAKTRGANTLHVNAFVGNDRGFNFYHKNGFKEYNVNFEKRI